jgi:hypothetical protein
VRRGGLWAKHNGIKARYYWEHPWGTHWELREHIGNLMGTHWELEGNKGRMKKMKAL